jgi:hypothetical protein
MNIVPLGQTYDYSNGYTSGQRACSSNIHLTKSLLKNVALMHLGQLLPSPDTINAFEYLQGFMQGFQDEKSGLATPLPDERGADHA